MAICLVGFVISVRFTWIDDQLVNLVNPQSFFDPVRSFAINHVLSCCFKMDDIYFSKKYGTMRRADLQLSYLQLSYLQSLR